MSRLSSLPSRFSITVPLGEDGMLGRRCPINSCLGYFKLKPGTGLPGSSCTCPYCGHKGDASKFSTPDQVAYARSVVINRVTSALLSDLKDMARSTSSRFLSMRVTGKAHPIRPYREQDLETQLTCEGCSLQYAIFGLFAFCPDCGAHNSMQTLESNLALAEKMLALAEREGLDAEVVVQIRGDALENAVAAFDGFGREATRVHAGRASDPARAGALSFQNLSGAQRNVQALFGHDLAAPLSSEEWGAACRSFQKRHLLAHKLGVVDDAYLAATNDPASVRGRKVAVTSEEVRLLLSHLRRIAAGLAAALRSAP